MQQMTQLAVRILLRILCHRSCWMSKKVALYYLKNTLSTSIPQQKNRSITNEGQTFLKTSEPSVIK